MIYPKPYSIYLRGTICLELGYSDFEASGLELGAGVGEQEPVRPTKLNLEFEKCAAAVPSVIIRQGAALALKPSCFFRSRMP